MYFDWFCSILGFSSYGALKGIFWDDKKYFFQALEESITGLAELNHDDSLKNQFKNELALYNQNFENFKLKLGHKNLIVNLCHELQKTNIEEFNRSTDYQTTITIPDNTSRGQQVIYILHFLTHYFVNVFFVANRSQAKD